MTLYLIFSKAKDEARKRNGGTPNQKGLGGGMNLHEAIVDDGRVVSYNLLFRESASVEDYLGRDKTAALVAETDEYPAVVSDIRNVKMNGKPVNEEKYEEWGYKPEVSF